MTTPAEVHAAAERARAREVGDVLAALRTVHARHDGGEVSLQALADELHTAGLRAAVPAAPAALTPEARRALIRHATDVRTDPDADRLSRDEVADRLLAAVRRDDAAPAFEQAPPELTVTVDDGTRARTWRVDATRDGVTFERRDEHERGYVELTLGLQPERPPQVLTWSCVPLASADGVTYTVTDVDAVPGGAR